MISINFDELSSESMLFKAPIFNKEPLKQITAFHELTKNKDHGIYSAYRQRVFNKYQVQESIDLANKLKESFKQIFLVGIGGSALGTKCVFEALAQSKKIDRDRIVVSDNLDPLFFEKNLNRVSMSETAFFIISKSGGTLETLAQFAIIQSKLKEANLDWKKHIVIITDPNNGPLRKLVSEHSLESLPIPSDVGGRFSVFSPSSLAPLNFAGIDIHAFVNGAENYFNNENSLEQTLKLAARISDLEKSGIICHVFMPYASILKGCAEWFVQLWGESLGKKSLADERVLRGPIPVAAVGDTDQHSLLQLLMEGKAHSLCAFLNVEKWNHDYTLNFDPELSKSLEKISYAKNKSFSQLLSAQLSATREALKQSGRPSYSISLEKLDEENIASLLAFYMDLTTASSLFYPKLNPYDQPGVELGKKILEKTL